jgi:glycosyltransferase involved in cell wall biosynthesis
MLEKLFNIDAFRSQPLPTEEEIMASWQGDINKPVVSVLCHTYNQKNYVEDAFRGFLVQKTDFAFEVIVHDDASTDGTSDIINEYATRFPKIFKPIIQTENQHSQGKKPHLLSSAYAKGEYCALCEGDDFWIEPEKLQQQVNYLKRNDNYLMAVHPAIQIETGTPPVFINDYYNIEKIINIEKFIRGGGGFIPTASIMVKKEIFDEMPEWFEKAAVGDYYIQCLGARNGVLFLPFKAAVYRYASTSSVSQASKILSSTKAMETLDKELKAIEELNAHYNYMYKDDIDFFKSKVLMNRAIKFLKQDNYDLFLYCYKLSYRCYRNNGRLAKILNYTYKSKIASKLLLKIIGG